MSLDQQLACLSLVNTNCSAVIKAYCKTPKTPNTKYSLSLFLPLSLTPSHFLYSFTSNHCTFYSVCVCVCLLKQTLPILFLDLCIYSFFINSYYFLSKLMNAHLQYFNLDYMFILVLSLSHTYCHPYRRLSADDVR